MKLECLLLKDLSTKSMVEIAQLKSMVEIASTKLMDESESKLLWAH